MVALEPELEAAVTAASSLVLGSNTIVGEAEQRVSLHARSFALARSTHVLFDWNLRVRRWRDLAEAVELARTLCEGSLLVKLNADEARLLTSEADPLRAARAVCALGARLARDAWPRGSFLRCEADCDAPGARARVVDTTGAGDALLGVVLAALVASGYDPRDAAEALPRAVAVAARTTETFGAVGAPAATTPSGMTEVA